MDSKTIWHCSLLRLVSIVCVMRPRPISATIFGILNIGYGAYNLLPVFLSNVGTSMGKIDADTIHLMRITGVVEGVAGILLSAAGIGLLMCKNWGRLISQGWGIFDILLTFAQIPLTYRVAKALSGQFGDAFAVMITLFALVFSMLYPAALVIFMRRPRLVEACRNPA